jgi:hypothetical protein
MPPVSAAKMAVSHVGVLFALTAVVPGAPAGGSAVVVTPVGVSVVVSGTAVVVDPELVVTGSVVDAAAGFAWDDATFLVEAWL